MDPLTIGLGVGALGGISNLFGAQKQRKQDAATALYSPWTGLKPKMDTKDPNLVGSIAGGGLSGYQLGQNMELNDAWKKSLAGGASPWASMSAPAVLAPTGIGAGSSLSGLQIDPRLLAFNGGYGQ